MTANVANVTGDCDGWLDFADTDNDGLDSHEGADNIGSETTEREDFPLGVWSWDDEELIFSLENGWDLGGSVTLRLVHVVLDSSVVRQTLVVDDVIEVLKLLFQGERCVSSWHHLVYDIREKVDVSFGVLEDIVQEQFICLGIEEGFEIFGMNFKDFALVVGDFLLAHH